MIATPPLVVVIEDDSATLKALGRVLRTGGFERSLTDRRKSFSPRHQREPPACLLLDVHLAGMSGLDLQRELKARGSTVPVIVMTAFDEGRMRDEARRIGCAAIWTRWRTSTGCSS